MDYEINLKCNSIDTVRSARLIRVKDFMHMLKNGN